METSSPSNQPVSFFGEDIAQNVPSQTPSPVIKQGWLRVLLYFVAFILVSGMFQGLGLLLLSVFTGEGANALMQSLETVEGAPYFLVIQLSALGGTYLVTWLFRRFIDKQTMCSLGFEYRERLSHALIGLCLGAGLIAVGFVALWLAGMLQVTELNFSSLQLLLYVVLLLAVSLNEEISVRGYMLYNLLQSFNKYLALAISAALFGILHALNPNFSVIALINIILAGLLLGIYYVHQKNLWFPIALHFAWNFFQGPVFGFEVSGINLIGIIGQQVTGSEWLTGGSFGFEGSALLSVLLIGAIGLTHFMYKPAKEEAVL